MLEEHLDYQIEDLPIPFFCVSCNLDTGSTNLHETGYLPDALRASAALPGIIPPAVVNQRLTIDGAVVNNLPVDVMRQKPVSRIVAVDLSSAEQMERRLSDRAVTLGDIPRALPAFRAAGTAFPACPTSCSRRPCWARSSGSVSRASKPTSCSSPRSGDFGMTEVKSFEKIVQAGYEHAITELGAWLEKTRNSG